MKKVIRRVCIIGANGAMGTQIAAMFASFGDATVYLVARDLRKAKEAKFRAVQSVRSDIILKNLIPSTFANLPTIVPKCDLVLETVAEDPTIKASVLRKVARFSTRHQIIASTTSSISITQLSQNIAPSLRTQFLGIHFFNPPYKMTLCEVIPSMHTDKKTVGFVIDYLKTVLYRCVIVSTDSPGFIANRIGFQTLHLALQYAQKHSTVGIESLEVLLGRSIGRSMGPFRTIDLVGFHIHQSIVEYLAATLPNEKRFFNDLAYVRSINQCKTPFKTFFLKRNGDNAEERLVFHFRSKDYRPYKPRQSQTIIRMSAFIRDGLYSDAFQYLASDQRADAVIMKHFLIQYVCYAFSLVGTVTNDYRDIDRAMGFGFNWLPPSAVVDLFGGVRAFIRLANRFDVRVPEALITLTKQPHLYTLQSELDYRSFIKA